MDIKLIKYASFISSDVFEAWQMETKRNIISVMPAPLSIDIPDEPVNGTTNSAIGIGCFVQYWETVAIDKEVK